MVESILMTFLILIPIVFGGIFIVNAISQQGKAASAMVSPAPSQSACVVNLTTNACSR